MAIEVTNPFVSALTSLPSFQVPDIRVHTFAPPLGLVTLDVGLYNAAPNLMREFGPAARVFPYRSIAQRFSCSPPGRGEERRAGSGSLQKGPRHSHSPAQSGVWRTSSHLMTREGKAAAQTERICICLRGLARFFNDRMVGGTAREHASSLNEFLHHLRRGEPLKDFMIEALEGAERDVGMWVELGGGLPVVPAPAAAANAPAAKPEERRAAEPGKPVQLQSHMHAVVGGHVYHRVFGRLVVQDIAQREGAVFLKVSPMEAPAMMQRFDPRIQLAADSAEAAQLLEEAVGGRYLYMPEVVAAAYIYRHLEDFLPILTGVASEFHVQRNSFIMGMVNAALAYLAGGEAENRFDPPPRYLPPDMLAHMRSRKSADTRAGRLWFRYYGQVRYLVELAQKTMGRDIVKEGFAAASGSMRAIVDWMSAYKDLPARRAHSVDLYRARIVLRDDVVEGWAKILDSVPAT